MKNILAIFIFLLIASTTYTQNTINSDAANLNWQADVPKIIHPNKQLVALYEKTWAITAGRVRNGPDGLPARPYLDENCFDDQIWIWDGCFMSLYAKYAPNTFPCSQTLLNYYIPIHETNTTPLKIHLRDNPPLFAWVEYDCYQFTGNKAHIDLVLNKSKFLQKHFIYFDTIAKGNINANVSIEDNPIYRGVVKDSNSQIIGYIWTGGASGMDNTPRGKRCGGYSKIMWIDAICQQALSALYIARLDNELGNKKESKYWYKKYDTLKNIINKLYWDEEDGFYYDVVISNKEHCKVKTMASFWALLAEVASPEQAKRMVEILKDEKYFGVKYPFPSLSRNDSNFNAATGDYWKGGIWLPMAYLGVKALEKYGYQELADEMATNIVLQQLRTYNNPHLDKQTIWEVYNPNKDEPSTEHGRRARPEFCGWSALGPISLVIENMLGFRNVNAVKREVIWDIKNSNGTHGIEGLYFRDIKTNLLYDASTKIVTVYTNKPYTLLLNHKKNHVKKGSNVIQL